MFSRGQNFMSLSHEMDTSSTGPGFFKRIKNRMIKGTEKNVTLKEKKEDAEKHN